MDDSTTVAWMSKAIAEAAKSAQGQYCTNGILPAIDPGIEVDGVGLIKLPLKPATAKALIAACQAAPYGKGTQTLVNPKVRKTYELDSKKFRLSEAWNAAIAAAIPAVAEQLGLRGEQLETRLYKLLVYERGGFFLPHRDSEKHDRMVASLIVVLPNRFAGGALIVRHAKERQVLPFDEAANGKTPCYAAFYADCEHEVQRVHSGIRLCLTYNLVLKPKRAQPAAKSAAPADVLAGSLATWAERQPILPLVFALEHEYTQRGLSLDLLKGADRRIANLVAAAAEKSDCLVHLAQVTRHLSQFADDGSFERSYSRYSSTPRRSELEIGETYEDDLHGTEWADVHGHKQPWGDIRFQLSSIVSSVPINDWKPTSEEFEGYTGNAGNTLDRWYHRSALVVWPRAQHYDVVASAGTIGSIPLLQSMIAKLTKTPKTRAEAARGDCIRFARAIIAQWPRRRLGYSYSGAPEKTVVDRFPELLLTLHDRDTIARLLARVGERDQMLRVDTLLVAACREFGWTAFAGELKHLLAAPTDSLEWPTLRDFEWLAAYCCDKAADPAKSALANELCAQAAQRFYRSPPSKPTYGATRQAAAACLTLMLKAILACGRDKDLAAVMTYVQQWPEAFQLDDSQVPCLIALIPWARRQFGSVHPQLRSWLAAVRQQLEAATAQRPTAPTDWERPAEVACTCQYCAQLKDILADPVNKVGRIAAAEHYRQHLVDKIRQHQCDVTHTLERKGSPYSLVLTKTTGSFDRAVKRFEKDRRLLASLPAEE